VLTKAKPGGVAQFLTRQADDRRSWPRYSAAQRRLAVAQAAGRAGTALVEMGLWREHWRNARMVADKVAVSRSRIPSPVPAPLQCYVEVETAARADLRGFVAVGEADEFAEALRHRPPMDWARAVR